ncbi:phosphatidylserine decarboxylase proenzyme, mitochondrial-like isoform X2 [Asterias rubens]|uniref:phosphatidylserine decarboxylase proenzyme, mitochondrial-like isoform X2 n=1 Tax=Asterias rubens TaxID=7604 RepID=UPI001455735F|nr:phosphatidylserine decarboxylase proenzyme, mitochondrial-like isoform X2 [Asterias rubens]XP_033628031.1 phosphatidylserine decarboxylase proenzyme, mitochondrial-like isoform X2 [Asterias rubens]
MEVFVHRCRCRKQRTYCATRESPRMYANDASKVQNNWTRRIGAAFMNYCKTLKWTPIPLGVGFAYICYLQYGHIKKREKRKQLKGVTPEEGLASPWQINVYKALPFRFTSRLWGQVNSLDVPHMLRKPIYGLYARLFNCNVSEALVEDLTWYQNLSDFFRRELKPGVRPVEQTRSLVSPCDGKVLHFGKVEKGWMEQVKGVTYTLQGFLGPSIRGQPHTETTSEIPEHDYQTSLSIRPGNSLYQCVIYLAPGDYHRFHSPTDWTINHRRHFPGLLFSVNPGVARWIRGLFNMNERVVLHGEWEHGFFSMTAVGATNVGSIGIYFDEDLRTNVPGRFKTGEYYDHHYNQSSNNNTKDNAPEGVQVVKGEGVGEFNLGSTIVLIFEAPKDFEFSFKPGEKIRLGEGISSL